MLDTSQNIFRRIVREVCTVYKIPPVRTFRIPDAKEDDEDAGAILGDYYGQMRLDEAMAEAHRLAKASTIVFLRPRVVSIPEGERPPMTATGALTPLVTMSSEQNEQGTLIQRQNATGGIPDLGTDSPAEMRLEIITPDLAHVVLSADDPTRMDGFAYYAVAETERGDTERAWIYYTRDTIRFLSDGGEQIKNPWGGEDELPNRYGIIPVVPFPCASQAVGFWNDNWNRDAYRANLIVGVLCTYMNFLVKTQSFKQMVFSGDRFNTQDLLNATIDPLVPITLPEGATAITLDLNTQLAAIDGVIRGKIMSIANNYGISAENFTITSQVASGYALRIMNRALEELRKADEVVCAVVEKGLFDIVRRIIEVDFPETAISPDLELRFNPVESSYPAAPQEEQARWEFEFKNGISSPVGYLIAKDPDLTREDAIAKLQQIKEENAEIEPERSALDLVFGGSVAGKGAKGVAQTA